jgi:quercetin dioxygenase-like cupin family protein
LTCGASSTLVKKTLYAGYPPSAGFFLPRENYNVHEIISFSGTQTGIDTLLSLLITRSAYITKEEYRMKITDVAKVVSGPNPHHVDARKIYESPHAMAVVITLKPGESLKKHVTPVDVFFYILEGSGVVEIGDEKQTVGKDMLVESPAKIPHRWSNESSSLFRVLVVKVPKPTEETRLL